MRTIRLKDANKKLADSLYQLLLKGDDFGALASKFSNDMVSAASNGQMQEFGVGEYDPVFENTVYALQKNAVSKPFLTSHGYHIVKLLEKLPPVTNTDAKAMETLRSKVEQSDRIASTRTALANRILKQAGYKKSSINSNELWAFSDSVLNSRNTGVPVHLSSSSDLFKIGDKNYLVSDWIGYAQTFRYKPDGSGLNPILNCGMNLCKPWRLITTRLILKIIMKNLKRKLTSSRTAIYFLKSCRERCGDQRKQTVLLLSNILKRIEANTTGSQVLML